MQLSEICYDLFCFQFVLFARNYNATPTVLLTANHSTTASGNSAPAHNGITTWIEVKVCFRSIHYSRITKLLNDYHDEKKLNETFGNLGRFLCLKFYFLVITKRLIPLVNNTLLKVSAREHQVIFLFLEHEYLWLQSLC